MAVGIDNFAGAGAGAAASKITLNPQYIDSTGAAIGFTQQPTEKILIAFVYVGQYVQVFNVMLNFILSANQASIIIPLFLTNPFASVTNWTSSYFNAGNKDLLVKVWRSDQALYPGQVTPALELVPLVAPNFPSGSQTFISLSMNYLL
jgi:hypothetical protein